MPRNSLLVIAAVVSALFCAGQVGAGQDLATLKGLKPPAAIDKDNPDVSFIRYDAVRDTALSLGSRAGLLARSEEIIVALKGKDADLDRIYNFSTLFLREKVMPPVIVEAQDAVTQNNDRVLRTSDRIYRIELPERLVTVVPTWRDYLYMGMLTSETVGQPHAALLPRNDAERLVWERAVEEGWAAGQHQADAIFDANMARLRRDFEGMVRYMLLLAKGMITQPSVASSHKTVTGNAKEMNVNDTVYAITESSGLVTNPKSWSPTLNRGKGASK